jgi:hypothetical protein
MEQSLDSAMRLADPYVIEEACGAIWNTCLPLLQPRRRRAIHSILQKCADSLDQIESNLNFLRASIHSELSKCEVLADFVDKV